MINAILRHIELLRDKVPDWAAYPFSIPAVKGLERLEFDPAVTCFVGENGSGKSTLLEAIVITAGFSPGGGTKNFTGSARPTESELHSYLRLARGARREKLSGDSWTRVIAGCAAINTGLVAVLAPVIAFRSLALSSPTNEA